MSVIRARDPEPDDAPAGRLDATRNPGSAPEPPPESDDPESDDPESDDPTTERPGTRQPVFLPLILAFVLVFVGIYLAVQIGITSTRFMPALNQPEPPLARHEPILGPAPRRLARRVMVIIIDGLRLADSYGLPYLDSLRRQGVDASANSHYPSISRPNHVTIVTGVPPLASGVRTNDYGFPVRLDSIMDRASAVGMRSAFASDYSDGLPLMFSRAIEDNRGGEDYHSAFFDPVQASWPGGLEWAIQRQVDQGYPLIVTIPGAVDAAGHQFGGDSVEYRSATRDVDAMLARALAHFDFTSDAVIITADHGHTDPGGHGGMEPEVIEVPLIMVGAGVRAGAAVIDAHLRDIAPTAAALLGLPAPGHSLGRALTEALLLDPVSLQLLDDSSQQRSQRNGELVASWHREGRRAVNAKRVWRLPLVAVLSVLGILFLLGAHRLYALRIDWRVLFIALPSFPLIYYALLALFGQQFSPSFVPERGSVIALLFRFGLMSTGAHIVVSWFAFRGRVVLAERLATANGLFVCGLLATLSIVGLLWALWPGPFVELPSPMFFVLIPATYVACACYGLAVVATLSLEIVVFFARAVDPRQLRPRQLRPRQLRQQLRRRRRLPRRAPM